MAQKKNKHKKSSPGAWYCTDSSDPNGEGCIACNVCYIGAPDFFTEDEDGFAFIKKQPVTPAEVALCKEQLESCPVGSIGNDGE